jgi:uncharacterized protein YjlB
MVHVTKYYLPPTALVPNSPQPLLHYTGLQSITPEGGRATNFFDLFEKNGWEVQWIFRYGPTQRSHYHSGIHECMAILSGTATIRFGVADTSLDMDENTFGPAKEDGGIEIQATAGNVFLLPAGTAHKTYKTSPEAGFTLLTPGDAHRIDSSDARAAVKNVELSGFTMLGAYPKDSGVWDSMKGGEDVGKYEKVWSVSKPARDPVLGKSEEGLCGLWS